MDLSRKVSDLETFASGLEKRLDEAEIEIRRLKSKN